MLREDIKPITYLKNRTAELVSEVHETGRAVVITQNGAARVVVMDVATYDRWRQETSLLRLIAHSDEAVRAGRILSTEEAFARAEEAIGAAEETE